MKTIRMIMLLSVVWLMSLSLSMTSIAGAGAETEADSKLIALTFDDGPNTYTTPQVLDLLEEYDAQATFFLVGDKISEESAEVVKRAYHMGCEIGSHSRTHSDMAGMTAEEIQAEMEYVDEYVYSLIGTYPKVFRPPYLSVSQTMFDSIDQTFITGYSSGDSNAEKTAQDVVDSVLASAKDGAIILMHDFYGNDKTVEALRTILPELQSQGYEFVTVTELFERRGETPVHGICYTEVQKYPCEDYILSENLFTGSVSGDKDWAGWKEAILLDGEKLEALGDTYAIEVAYESTRPPVIVLHRWKSAEDNLWEAVQPAYYNGVTACFLAKDLLAVLDEYGMTYTDMSLIMLRTFVTEMTITKADLLVRESTGPIMGDVNLDGRFSMADAAALQKWLLAASEQELPCGENGDLGGDGRLDVFDLCMMKQELLSGGDV
ncbi:MAG: polysaccharide deacetylase family protein [Ruminococcus sp.]|nr:polysaccharide deacetylase family protein [Ruminococcus sp.]